MARSGQGKRPADRPKRQRQGASQRQAPSARAPGSKRVQAKTSDHPDPRKHQEPVARAISRTGLLRQGRLPEKTGLVLTTRPTKDYALIDSGLGLKLERHGATTVVRPEGQAIWQPRLPQKNWDAADAIFTGDTDEEGMGRWAFPKRSLDETWPTAFDGMPFLARFTSFRHVGVFPEQDAHWRHMQGLIETAKQAGRTPTVLNLFGYTGVASLVAARAGARVTHVDASKKAIGWARENQDFAGLADAPIRWICEDAVRFCEREVRRENTYDIVLLDPPAFGRGPKGERWQLFEHLPHLLDLCKTLVTERSLTVVLTAYAIRASHFAFHELMQDAFSELGGHLESGELVIEDEAGDRSLSTSLFSRWQSGGGS
ncbi:MAG: class I SAM-dependent methyltransferase [Pseudomonadota bacterium]